MARPWFRMYREILGSPKVQKLKPELFKAWINILCCTGDDGSIPDAADLAFMIRVTEDKTAEYIAALVKVGLIDEVDGINFAHNWDRHQYASDGDSYSSEKQKRYRERKRAAGNSDGNGDGSALPKSGNGGSNALPQRYDAVTKTLPPRTDTDTDTEQNREGETRAKTRDASPTKGTRWESGKPVPDDWIADAGAALRSAGLSPVNLKLEAQKFADYWAARAGKDGVKADWKATWRNWARRASQDSRSNGASLGGGMGPA